MTIVETVVVSWKVM